MEPVQGRTSIAQWENWWWFRASRMVRDYDLSGAPSGIQPIDEFPAFSFVLADMHPHVLALPFAVLALGLALNLLLTEHDATRPQLVLYALAIGGLIFLNTWDGPIYLAILIGAEALRRLRRNGTGLLMRADWLALIRLALIVGGLAVVCYLPFLISFRSQLSGILPNVIHATQFQQFFAMFGPFLIVLVFFLGVEVWRGQEEMNWSLARNVLGFGLLALVLSLVVLGVIAWLRPEIRGAVYSIVDAAGGLAAQVGTVLRIRLIGLPVLILLGGMAFVVVARLFGRTAIEEDEAPYAASTGFALLLVGAGALLALFPDYLYLRDNFATRINTVFKFYYQAWLVWSIASAYAAYTILADVEWHIRPSSVLRGVFAVVLVGVLVLGMVYPVLADVFAGHRGRRTPERHRREPALAGWRGLAGARQRRSGRDRVPARRWSGATRTRSWWRRWARPTTCRGAAASRP